MPLSVEVPGRPGHHWGVTGLGGICQPLRSSWASGCAVAAGGLGPGWVPHGSLLGSLLAGGVGRRKADAVGKNVAHDRRRFRDPTRWLANPLVSDGRAGRLRGGPRGRCAGTQARGPGAQVQMRLYSPLDLALCFSPRPPLELGDQGPGRMTCQSHSQALNPSAQHPVLSDLLSPPLSHNLLKWARYTKPMHLSAPRES